MIFEILDNQTLKREFWAELVKLRAGYACERCGDSESRLDAHHKDEDSSNHVLSNGECLCIRCHSSETFTGIDRSDQVKAVWDRMTPEERSEQIRRMNVGRSDQVRSMWSGLSEEERSRRAQKGWETRRSKEATA